MVTGLSKTRLMNRRKGKRIHDKLLIPGYPGLKSTALQISEYIPKSRIYCEPFAGLGRLTRHIKADIIILNDISDFSVKHNKSKFPNAIIEKMDFIDTIKKYDSNDTFFLIDPPFRYDNYALNNGPECNLKPFQYYEKLFELLPNVKANWILCSDREEHEIKKICSKSGYPTLKINSKKTFFKRKIGVLLTSNRPIIRHNQNTLEFYNL